MRPSCAVLVCVAFPLGTFGFGRLSFTRGAAPNATADPCDNYHESCAGWADAGECESNRPYMYASCRLACGMCTRREGSTASSIASRLIRLATSRTTSSTSSTSSSPRPPAPLPSRQKPPSLRHECRDVSREECERRMSAGECDSHEGEVFSLSLTHPFSPYVTPHSSYISPIHFLSLTHSLTRPFSPYVTPHSSHISPIPFSTRRLRSTSR